MGVLANNTQIVPPQPRKIQVRLRFRAYHQPYQLSLGPEGVQWVPWR